MYSPHHREQEHKRIGECKQHETDNLILGNDKLFDRWDACISKRAIPSNSLQLTVLVDLKPTKHAERRAVGDAQESGAEDTKSDRQTAAELAGANGVAHRE